MTKRKRGRSGSSKPEPAGARKHEGSISRLYLSRAVLILACAVIFLPVVTNSDFYYPFVFLKSILFRLVVQLMTLLYVVLAVVSPPHRPRFNRIIYALFAYFGVLLISSLPGISASVWSSWCGDFRRMGGMVTQLHLLAYFFILTQALKQEREWLVLFSASLFSAVLMGFSGLVQYLGLDFIYGPSLRGRIQGATGNPVFFGVFMMLSFLVVLWFLSRKDKGEVIPFIAKTWLWFLLALDGLLVLVNFALAGSGPGILSTGMALFPVALFVFLLHGASVAWFFARRSVGAGVAMLGVLGLYFLFWINASQTRAAAVGLGGALVFFSVFYLWAGTGRLMKWTAASLFLLLTLSTAAVWVNRDAEWVRSQPALARFATTSFSEERIMAWKAGALGFLDRPVLGWGPENYKIVFDRHFPPRVLTYPGAGLWFDRAHNFLVDIGTGSGFLGLAVYLAFVATVFAYLLRRWHRTREAAHSLILAALLFGYLVTGLFTFDSVNTDGTVFLVLAYVAWLYGIEYPGREEVPSPHNAGALTFRQGALITAAAALLFAACWYVVKRPFGANLLLSRAVVSGKVVHPQSKAERYLYREETVDLYRRAATCRTTGRFEAGEAFAEYASNLAQAPEIPLQDRIGVVREAFALLEEHILQEPNNVRRHMNLSGLTSKVVAVVRQYDPGLARALCERTLVLLEKAEKLSPTRPQVYLDRAAALVALDRPGEAIPAFETASSLNPEVKERRTVLLALYISTGHYEDAAKEWQKIRASFPVSAADYEPVIRLYTAKRHFAPVVALYKEQLEKLPNDAFLTSRLAAAYWDLGEKELAKETALKAAKLSPKASP